MKCKFVSWSEHEYPQNKESTITFQVNDYRKKRFLKIINLMASLKIIHIVFAKNNSMNQNHFFTCTKIVWLISRKIIQKCRWWLEEQENIRKLSSDKQKKSVGNFDHNRNHTSSTWSLLLRKNDFLFKVKNKI
jgi:hypothetical protein